MNKSGKHDASSSKNTNLSHSPQSNARKRANAFAEPPVQGRPRANHVTQMGEGIDAKHSQMQGPKSMTDVLAEHIGQTKKQRNHITQQVDLIKQRQKQHAQGQHQDTQRAINLMERHSSTLAKGGKQAQLGLKPLTKSHDALDAATDVQRAFSPFFKHAEEDTTPTDTQREQAATAIKSMVGALKQFGPLQAKNQGFMEQSKRTFIDQDTGTEVDDSDKAREMRAFVSSFVKNKKAMQGLVPDKQHAENNKPSVTTHVDETGKKSHSITMQSSHNKQHTSSGGMQALFNIANMAQQATSVNKADNLANKQTDNQGKPSSGSATTRERANAQTSFGGAGNALKQAQALNVFSQKFSRPQQKVTIQIGKATSSKPQGGKTSKG